MWVECLNPVWWCTSSVPARPGRLTTWAKRSVCIDRGATGAHRDGLNAAPLPYTQRTQTGFFSFPPPGWQLHKVGLIGDFFLLLPCGDQKGAAIVARWIIKAPAGVFISSFLIVLA